MNFVYPQVAINLPYGHAWNTVVMSDWCSWNLELLNKPQNRICTTVGPSLAAFLEPLVHCCNVASLSLFYRYYFGRCSSELAHLVPIPYSHSRSTPYSVDCMIFLSPFLDVARMSMTTIFSSHS